AQKITGRRVRFKLNEPTPLAREHADALLGQLERYPHTNLRFVGMDDTAEPHILAATEHDGSAIYFSPHAVSGGEFAHRDMLTGGAMLHMQLASTPADVAVHEFAHVVATSHPALEDRAAQRADLFAHAQGTSVAYMAESISMNAGTNR